MKKYTIEVEYEVKAWQSGFITVPFDGTAEELKEYLKDKNPMKEFEEYVDYSNFDYAPMEPKEEKPTGNYWVGELEEDEALV